MFYLSYRREFGKYFNEAVPHCLEEVLDLPGVALSPRTSWSCMKFCSFVELHEILELHGVASSSGASLK